MLHKPTWKLSWKQYLTSLTTNVDQVITMQLLHVFQLHTLLPILPKPNNQLPCWFSFPPSPSTLFFLVKYLGIVQELQHVITSNQLIVLYLWSILHANEAMTEGYGSLLILTLNLERFIFPIVDQNY